MWNASNASRRLLRLLVPALPLALLAASWQPSSGSRTWLAGPPAHAAESTLRYAAGNFGEESMDPTRTSISASLGLVGPLWDWLTEVDANGKLTPGLALSWEPAADGLSWTFRLRPGVKFHDGSEMTAEDARFTLMEGFRRPEAKSSRVRQFRKGIRDVRVIDRYNFEVATARPWPTFPYDVSNQPGIEGIVLPKAYVGKVGWDGFAQKPVGTGAWKFAAHEVGNFIEFEAVEDHWRGSPRFDRLRVLLVPEVSTRTAMLKTGQVDVARISLDEVPEMTEAGFEIAEDPQPTSVRIHLYGTYRKEAGPTGDVRVRRALNLAIDREEIVETLFHGKAKPAAVFPVSPISIGFPADLEPYPYDPAQARKLLAEAGYPNGFSLELFALPTGGFTQYRQLAEVVAGFWEAVGVKTSIVPTDIGAFRPLYIATPQSPRIIGQAGTFATTGRLNGSDDLRIWWSLSGKIIKLADNVDDIAKAAAGEASIDGIAAQVARAYEVLHRDYRGVPIADVKGILWAYGNRAADIRVRPHRGYIEPSLATAVPAR